MGFPLYVNCCFSLAALNSLSLCLVFASLISMCFGVFPRLKVGGEGDSRGWEGCMASLTQWTWVWVNTGSWWWTGRPGVLQSKLLDITEWQLNWHVSPWVYPVWDSLRLLDLIDCFLFHVGEIFNYNLFKKFPYPFLFSSSSGTPLIQMLVLLILSQRSLRLSPVLFILSSFFCSSEVISTILSSSSLIHSSASDILLLIPSRVFLISVIVLCLYVYSLILLGLC